MLKERTVHLRIKIKSLVAESRIIRAEARKTSKQRKYNLNQHRTSVVRVHTRLNLLAYGILRNIPYEVMEKKCREKPNFMKIQKIAISFGAKEDVAKQWVDNALKYYFRKRQIPLAA